ncbi:MAG: metallophosphoesterase [Pseudomonadota bacterium]
MSDPIYAIGDIHGQLGMLQAALARIEADSGADARIVFLGDYADRGPNSRGVLDLLSRAQAQRRNWVFLKGNHDRMFEYFLQTPPREDPYMMVELYWLHPRLGGDMTLASYGVDARGTRRLMEVHRETLDAVPQAHRDFLQSLVLTHETDDLFFVHAGIRGGVSLADQTEMDMLWIRKEFHNDARLHPKLIVHGHTPVDVATNYGNRVNLDTGAGYGKPLTAAVFADGEVWQLTDTGRVPLAKP